MRNVDAKRVAVRPSDWLDDPGYPEFIKRLAALCDGTRSQEKYEPHESDASTNTMVHERAAIGGAKIDNAGECRVSQHNRCEQERE